MRAYEFNIQLSFEGKDYYSRVDVLVEAESPSEAYQLLVTAADDYYNHRYPRTDLESYHIVETPYTSYDSYEFYSKKYPDSNKYYVQDGKFKQFNASMRESIRRVFKESTDPISVGGIIHDAIMEEITAVKLYQEKINLIDNPEVDTVLSNILEEEQVHIGELMALLKQVDPDIAQSLADGESEVLSLIDAPESESESLEESSFTTYAVRWQEFDRNDRVVTKEREFKTAKAREAFIIKLEEKDSFFQILAYSDPDTVTESTSPNDPSFTIEYREEGKVKHSTVKASSESEALTLFKNTANDQGRNVQGATVVIQDSEIEEAYSDDQMKIANSTSRSKGASAINPDGSVRSLVARYVLSSVPKEASILDFGAGKDAVQAQVLRSQGYTDVTAYDFGSNSKEGLHDPDALSRTYDVVFASIVLYVSTDEDMLIQTIKEIWNSVKSGGKCIFNYPSSPRKAGFSAPEVSKIVEDILGIEPTLVSGTKSAPVWEVVK